MTPHDTAYAYSHYLRQWSARLGEEVFSSDVALGWNYGRMQRESAALLHLSEAEFGAGLRRLRQRIMSVLCYHDLTHTRSLEDVMHTMSDWAECAIQAGLNYYMPRLIERYGRPLDSEGETMPLWVLGMGKLGGRELNVSSDIDLIFLYEEEGETCLGEEENGVARTGRRAMSHAEFFTELAKKLVMVLNNISEYGQVFRVDMRLRPYGDSGPLVMSLEALEDYFSTQGRLWERYAWIKARLLNTDVSEKSVQRLEKVIQPFVFRRYWDFNAYEGLRDLYGKIRSEAQRKDLKDHIKLSEGGIRYIEFIAQLFQLIRGGREPELRARATLETLTTLADKSILEASRIEQLKEAYHFLRVLEHRLQYREDQQTHTLPATEAEWQALVATYQGMTVAELKAKIQEVRALVSDSFTSLLQLNAPEMPMSLATVLPWHTTPERLGDGLISLGLSESCATRAAQRMVEWMKSLRFRRLPAQSQNSLEHVLPYLVQASVAYGEQALFRALDVLEAVSARSSYVALFREHPPVLDRLLRMVSASAWAGEYLKQYPLLLDELVHGIPDAESMDIDGALFELERGMQRADGEEQKMEHLRHWQRIQTFRCLCCDVEGKLTIEAVSDYLSWTADHIIGAGLQGAWQALTQQHCEVPHLAVLAYGKLGGKELGYAGDVDVVFVYDDPFDLAAVRYARLAQKWIHWMMALTPAGRLYDVDVRLRPEGESGLLIASWDSFERYQLERAHVWEHQALTRARWVAGDVSLKARFDQLKERVLMQQRDHVDLWRMIQEMREKMRLQHPDLSHRFDIKKSRGGMIDIEFAVQYLVLGWGAVDSRLRENIGNIALLRHSGQQGYLSEAVAERAIEAYRSLRAVGHQSQLQGIEAMVPRDDPRVNEWKNAVEALYKGLPI